MKQRIHIPAYTTPLLSTLGVGLVHLLQQRLPRHHRTSERPRLLGVPPRLAQVWTQALAVLANQIPVLGILPPQAPWTNHEAGSTLQC